MSRPFEVRIVGANVVHGHFCKSSLGSLGRRSHIVYKLEVWSEDAEIWTLDRRYSQFRNLHGRLCKAAHITNLPGQQLARQAPSTRPSRMELPSLPRKRWNGKCNPKFVQQRELDLQQYIDDLLNFILTPGHKLSGVLLPSLLDFFDWHRRPVPMSTVQISTMAGDFFTFEAPVTDSVLDLKSQIYHTWNIELCQQNFVCGIRKVSEVENLKHLVGHDGVVHLGLVKTPALRVALTTDDAFCSDSVVSSETQVVSFQEPWEDYGSVGARLLANYLEPVLGDYCFDASGQNDYQQWRGDHALRLDSSRWTFVHARTGAVVLHANSSILDPLAVECWRRPCGWDRADKGPSSSTLVQLKLACL